MEQFLSGVFYIQRKDTWAVFQTSLCCGAVPYNQLSSCLKSWLSGDAGNAPTNALIHNRPVSAICCIFDLKIESNIKKDAKQAAAFPSSYDCSWTWSAALLDQQFAWTIEFPFDGPEAGAQPQSVTVLRWGLRWRTAFEKLLDLRPQSASLQPQHESHLKGWHQGVVHCNLVQGTEGPMVASVHAQVY